MGLCAAVRSWVGRYPVWALAGLLVCLVFATYGRSLANGPVWDDRFLITDNPYLQSIDGLLYMLQTDLWTASGKREPSSFYRPLTMVTFWLNAQVAGQSAAAMRAGNILLHAANAVLLLLVMRKLIEPPRMFVAALLAMLWAVLAVNSEPVFWISGRFDPLVGIAALLCLLGNRLSGWRATASVGACVAAGLLFKEAFMGWLPILLLDDLLVLRRPFRRVWVKYALVAVVVILNLIVRQLVGIPSLSVLSETGLGTLVEAYLFTAANLTLKVFVPIGLDPFHPYAPWPLASNLLVGSILLVTSGLLAWRALRRGATASARVAALGWSWMLLAFVPASVTGPNLFMIGDRYAYLPVMGMFIAGYALLGPCVSWLEHRWGRRAAMAVGVCLMSVGVGQGWVVVQRAADWRNDRSLAEASVRAHPHNPYALYDLGRQAVESGDLERAETLLLSASQRNPRSWRTPNAICVLRLRQNRLSEALAACHKSIAFNDKNPRAWSNLASVHVNAGQWAQARKASLRAVALKPHYAEGRYLVAVSAANLGHMREAREHLQAGLAEEPSHQGLVELEQAMSRQHPR